MANEFWPGSLRTSSSACPRWVYVVAALALAIVFPLLEQAGLMETLWLRVGHPIADVRAARPGPEPRPGRDRAAAIWATSRSSPWAPTRPRSSPRRCIDIHWNFWVIMLLLSIAISAFLGFLVGLPDAAIARGLPRHRHAGLRRDHAYHVQQLGRASPTVPAASPASIRPSIFGWVIDKPFEFYYLILAFVVRHRDPADQPQELADRARHGTRCVKTRSRRSTPASTRTSMKMLAVVISSGIAGLAGVALRLLPAVHQPDLLRVHAVGASSSAWSCSAAWARFPASIAGARRARHRLPEIIRQAFSKWLPDLLGEDAMNFLPGGSRRSSTGVRPVQDALRSVIIIVVMVIFRPEGLLPDALWRREVHEDDPREQEQTRQKTLRLRRGPPGPGGVDRCLR